MDELSILLLDIEKLREQLNKLIHDKQGNLKDPEIITASQMLNSIITKYSELITKKLNE